MLCVYVLRVWRHRTIMQDWNRAAVVKWEVRGRFTGSFREMTRRVSLRFLNKSLMAVTAWL